MKRGAKICYCYCSCCGKRTCAGDEAATYTMIIADDGTRNNAPRYSYPYPCGKGAMGRRGGGVNEQACSCIYLWSSEARQRRHIPQQTKGDEGWFHGWCQSCGDVWHRREPYGKRRVLSRRNREEHRALANPSKDYTTHRIPNRFPVTLYIILVGIYLNMAFLI